MQETSGPSPPPPRLTSARCDACVSGQCFCPLLFSVRALCSADVAQRVEKIAASVAFFFVLSYSHEAYLDYGGVHF